MAVDAENTADRDVVVDGVDGVDVVDGVVVDFVGVADVADETGARDAGVELDDVIEH